MIPSRLGPYKLIASIGAGGMGEVYRAEDPRLKRSVAIKILPAEVVNDPGRLGRFRQEAQAASRLNHPNILVVHDIGAENGVHYIVSELVEGESLRKLMQKGPVPVKQLLELAAQIAEGLAAAHQAGIVHRDLKPENIIVTPENRVKILDFGLAKLRPPIGNEEEETVTGVFSQTGIIQGTPPYMSPEQASGKTVDFRSDQFSFGSILYELAAGKRAFDRPTTAQTLAAIITEEPTPLPPVKLPAPFVWLVERCLAKDPHQRYDSTADLYRDLRSLREHLSKTTSASELAVPVRPRRRVWIQWAMILAVGLGVAAGVYSVLSARSGPGDLSSYKITRLVTGTGQIFPSRWSPDSNMICYATQVDGIRQVFTKDMQSLVSNQVTNSKQHCSMPVWSVDGTRIYYTSGGDLWAVSAAGGPAERILENVQWPAISVKANALAFRRTESGAHTLWISSPPAKEPRKYSSLPANTKAITDSTISFSPDGSEISLWAQTAEGLGFWILPYPSGKPRRIRLPEEVAEPSYYSWMPDNEHIVFGSHSFFSGKAHLQMVRIKDGNSRPLTAGYFATESTPSVSPDGLKIAFSTAEYRGDLVEIPLDGSVSRPITTGIFAPTSPTWSPAGTQYAFAGENSGVRGIWLMSVSDHWIRPIVTSTEPTDTFDSPSFSPDGQRIAYQSHSNELWVSPVSGGKPVRFVSHEYAPDFPSWSPDGNWIAFNCQRQNALAKVETTGSGTPIILKKGIKYHPTRWSPKGNWITCAASEGLTLVSPDGKTSELLVPGNWGNHAWSRDGRTIYGLKFEGERAFLCSVDTDTRIEKRLNELAHRSNAQYLGFSLSPDGSSVLTAEVHVHGTMWLLEGFPQPTGFFSRLWH